MPYIVGRGMATAKNKAVLGHRRGGFVDSFTRQLTWLADG